VDIDSYQRNYTAQYQGGAGWFETVLVASRRRQVALALDRYPHERVLEVGCGLDPIVKYISGIPALTTVEPVAEFVEEARKTGAAHPDYVVLQGFLEDVLPDLEARRPFDFIIVSSVLHEVVEPDKFLQAIVALCGPETVVHIDVPNVRSLHRLLAQEMGLIADIFEPSETEKKFQRTTRFDADRFHRTLEGAGFEVVRSGTYFIKPFSHGQMEAVIDKGIVSRELLEGLEKLVDHLPEFGAEMFADVRLRSAAARRA
jgi:2-polyprenyl-3-methyl-5-hydroxy-6-metoxy-1,4-benzoquinol methylase